MAPIFKRLRLSRSTFNQVFGNEMCDADCTGSQRRLFRVETYYYFAFFPVKNLNFDM